MNSPACAPLTALLLALAVTTAGAAPFKPKIAWSPCYRDYGPFECGTVQVPLDYADPGGASISIAVVRLPASDPAHRIGSLFVNPGGPGGSGFEFVLAAGQFLFPNEVRERFDIVGFDPRGIESSSALRCFGNARQWGPYFTPFPFPITDEEVAAWEASDRYLEDACDQRAGRIIDHMSTADVARDLDQLRQAVGDEGLNYVGFSYGSYLGVTYASLFPDKVRAVVVNGVLDPIAWSTGVPGEGPDVPVSTRIHSAAGAQATLAEFFRLCDAGGPNCAFAGGAAARFAALAAKLEQHPVPVLLSDGTSFDFTYAQLIAFALGALYSSGSWPSFAQTLAALDAGAPAAVLGARLGELWRALGFTSKRGLPEYSNGVEGFPGVLCADSDNPSAYSAWPAASAAEEVRYGYFGPIWTWASSPCSAWPGGHEGRYVGPFSRSTANPVLVMNTLYDPATRYEGAVEVASLLPNSRLVTVAGWGHTTLFLSRDADEAMARYLVDGTLPPVGTTYAQDFVPFTGSAALASGTTAVAGREILTEALVPDVVRRLPRSQVAGDSKGPSSASPDAGASPDPATRARGGRPSTFELLPNHPNPFPSATTISFAIPERCRVRLTVYTLLGQEVATLLDGEVDPGWRSVQWNGTDAKGRALPPGVYMYRLEATSLDTGTFHRVGKMTLLR